jgi:hypothetical protein
MSLGQEERHGSMQSHSSLAEHHADKALSDPDASHCVWQFRME